MVRENKGSSNVSDRPFELCWVVSFHRLLIRFQHGVPPCCVSSLEGSKEGVHTFRARVGHGWKEQFRGSFVVRVDFFKSWTFHSW